MGSSARRTARGILVAAFLAGGGGALGAGPASSAREPSPPPDLAWFFEAASRDERVSRAALDRIAERWHDGYTPLIVDLARFMRPAPRPGRGAGPDAAREALPADDEGDTPLRGAGARPPLDLSAPPDPSSFVRGRLMRWLEERTGQRFGDDLARWRQWMWARPYEPHPQFAAFKGALYGQIDPRMREFFRPPGRSRIRLDYVDWGGVGVNGIPPLVNPATVPAGDAGYLKDGHVVFGLVVGGEARAYPKRILAWHELARDRVGGVELTIVYCTLCGTVIPYESTAGGRRFTFGTSGLLYESNKLMFDEETMSLWSSLEGRPVIGPLADSGLALTLLPVVTTTWGEWRAAHPSTTVLSLETGHERDYSEGAAYRDYFSTDRLMFRTSRTDPRLANKAEVLALRLRPAGGGPAVPVAFAASFLARQPVHHVEEAGRKLVIVTSRKGANRVYDAGPHRFSALEPDGVRHAGSSALWRLTEDALIGPDGTRLPRVPAHRAFWFA